MNIVRNGFRANIQIIQIKKIKSNEISSSFNISMALSQSISLFLKNAKHQNSKRIWMYTNIKRKVSPSKCVFSRCECG